jgi:hypothetical protein
MIEFFRRISLQSILALDATTCVVMGVLLVCASGLVSGLTLVPAPLLLWAGLLLLPIAGFMAFFSRIPIVPAWAVQMIILGNLLWVLGSVALPVFGLISLNAFGWIFILAQAAVVAMFVVLEWSASQRPAAAI